MDARASAPPPAPAGAGPGLVSAVGKAEWLDPPVAVRGAVQRGFGRGSRDLGTPTANLPGGVLDGVAQTARNGVYCGFGYVPALSAAPVKMVASVGLNTTYGDVTERVLEAYLMDDALAEEFYGEEMRLCIVAYMRPEIKFDSIQALIANIRNDVAVSKEILDLPQATAHSRHKSLQEP